MSEEVQRYDEDGVPMWQVPEYLRNVYAIWSLTAEAWGMVNHMHTGSHMAADGYQIGDGEVHLPDSLATAVMEAPIVNPEGKRNDLTVHHMITAAVGALGYALEAIHKHVSEMDSLPPWWDETMTPFHNFPEMWGEGDDDES